MSQGIKGWGQLEAALAAYGTQPWLCMDDVALSGEQVLARCRRRTTSQPAPADTATVVPCAPGRRDVLTLLQLWCAGISPLLVSDHEPGGSTRHSVDMPRVLPDGTATLTRTAGTTGTPKLAVHALSHHLASATAAGRYFGLGRDHSWLLALPLYHVGGLAVVFRTLVAGARCVVAGADLPTSLAAHRPTHVSLVTTQLVRLLDDPRAISHLTSAEAVLVGGGPIPTTLRRRALALGIPLVTSYGATETSSMVSAERDPGHVIQPHCAGHPVPGHRIEVAEDGAILVGGDALFLGYVDQGQFIDPRDTNGLFATGDLGKLDADGRLYVHGRADLMIISGGENMHPEEIEAALLDFEGITEAIVIAEADREFGQRLVACLAGTPSSALTRTALVRHLEARLPRFKIPRTFLALPPQTRLKRNRAQLTAGHLELTEFFDE